MRSTQTKQPIKRFTWASYLFALFPTAVRTGKETEAQMRPPDQLLRTSRFRELPSGHLGLQFYCSQKVLCLEEIAGRGFARKKGRGDKEHYQLLTLDQATCLKQSLFVVQFTAVE